MAAFSHSWIEVWLRHTKTATFHFVFSQTAELLRVPLLSTQWMPHLNLLWTSSLLSVFFSVSAYLMGLLLAKHVPWNESPDCFCSFLLSFPWRRRRRRRAKRGSSIRGSFCGGTRGDAARWNPTEGPNNRTILHGELCSSWLFWASVLLLQACVPWLAPTLLGEPAEGRGGGDSVSEFTVAACHRTPSLTYSSKWIRWDCCSVR